MTFFKTGIDMRLSLKLWSTLISKVDNIVSPFYRVACVKQFHKGMKKNQRFKQATGIFCFLWWIFRFFLLWFSCIFGPTNEINHYFKPLEHIYTSIKENSIRISSFCITFKMMYTCAFVCKYFFMGSSWKNNSKGVCCHCETFSLHFILQRVLFVIHRSKYALKWKLKV